MPGDKVIMAKNDTVIIGVPPHERAGLYGHTHHAG